MKIFGDYHTHTIYSHGKGTIRQNVEAALKKGLREIAICDHGPSHVGFGVKKKDFYKMRNEIDELNKEFKEKGINILLGVEANIIGYDGTIDVDSEIIDMIDILLVGFHFGALPKSPSDIYNIYVANFIGRFSSNINENMKEKNTQALIKAINRYPIDLITHPGAKVDINTRELAKAAVKRGTALEINSSHGQLSLEYIKIALEEGVDFYINSDAHTPENVGNVDEGIKRALMAEVPIKRIRNAVE